MDAPIIFPDTGAAVIAYLAGVAGCPVTRAVPDVRPSTFVTVQRQGGTSRNLVTDEAQLGIECWAQTPEAAHDLAQLVRGHINALPGAVASGVRFYRVTELAGPADLPDPLSGQSRFVFAVLVASRAD